MSDSTRQSVDLAVLFADVVGSTKLYELLGDARARSTVAMCIDAMTRATHSYGGTVIKTMGDEIMATFGAADAAVEAACNMQKLIREDVNDSSVPVSIRVGMHFGPVMPEDGDVFGTTVHTANRMTSQAKSAQIITTLVTVEHLSPHLQAMTRQIDLAPVKGRKDEIALYEVLWQRDESTTMLPTINLGAAANLRQQRLLLRYQDHEIVVDEDKPNVNIGRSDDSDLVVKDTLISRLHARIEYSRGKFMLVDESTNGTCLISNDGEEVFVRRDSVQIKGRGIIGLGRIAQPNSAHTVFFSCED